VSDMYNSFFLSSVGIRLAVGRKNKLPNLILSYHNMVEICGAVSTCEIGVRKWPTAFA
jgi:hypothetical protein